MKLKEPLNLYPYQIEAMQKMKNGCILNGSVGSGKSRTALLYYFYKNGGALVESSLIDYDEEDIEWGAPSDNQDEYIPMSDPPQDLYIITTAKKRDDNEWESEMVPFLMSPDPSMNLYSNKIVIDSWNNIQKYRDVTKSFFIFDEDRVTGNGAWVKAFLKITKSNDWIILSATPGDTWSDYIPVFIANGFYRNRTQFNEEHVVFKPFTQYPIIDHYINTGKLIKLRDSILVNMNFKRVALQNHIDVYVDYDKQIYRDIIRYRWNYVENQPIQNAAEYCYCLRRCVNSDEQRIVACMEIVEEHMKVIIFYNFDYELELLKNARWGDDVTVAQWNGHKHEPIPDTQSWVYLVQYTAGAEGWNTTSTDTMIFYSQNYSYKTMTQAAGRIDRLNTPFKILYYYHLKSKSSIDMAISRTIKSKKQFNERQFYGNK